MEDADRCEFTWGEDDEHFCSLPADHVGPHQCGYCATPPFRRDPADLEAMLAAQPDVPDVRPGEFVFYGPEGQVELIKALPLPALATVNAYTWRPIAWTAEPSDPSATINHTTITYRRIGEWSYQRSVP